LSKEDEVAAGGEEVEVRREDQDKINRFSRLHQREISLEDELKSKHVRYSSEWLTVTVSDMQLLQKEKEDLDDVSNELELADDEAMIPLVQILTNFQKRSCCWLYPRYQIGDSFISLPLPEVQEMLSRSTEKIEEEVMALEEKLGTIRDEMQELKFELYARFGRSINLET
jgi:prefoldin subunit 4